MSKEHSMIERGVHSGLQVGMSAVVAMTLKTVFIPKPRHGAHSRAKSQENK